MVFFIIFWVAILILDIPDIPAKGFGVVARDAAVICLSVLLLYGG